MKHLSGLRSQGLPNLLGTAPALNHRFTVTQQMRPNTIQPLGVPEQVITK
jgi:hypothetical protein